MHSVVLIESGLLESTLGTPKLLRVSYMQYFLLLLFIFIIFIYLFIYVYLHVCVCVIGHM